MKRIILTFVALTLAVATAGAEDKIAATLYKIPGCLCCDWYANYLRSNGFEVKVVESRNMTLIRNQHGVPPKLEGCHTTVVGGYVVEGQLPVTAVKRLLIEQPTIKGIHSLPCVTSDEFLLASRRFSSDGEDPSP